MMVGQLVLLLTLHERARHTLQTDAQHIQVVLVLHHHLQHAQRTVLAGVSDVKVGVRRDLQRQQHTDVRIRYKSSVTRIDEQTSTHRHCSANTTGFEEFSGRSGWTKKCHSS